MTDPLAPAAQAILHAYSNTGTMVDGPNIAAVLRAVADQVVRETPRPSADSDYHLMCWSKYLDQYALRQQTPAELLAIAAELETKP